MWRESCSDEGEPPRGGSAGETDHPVVEEIREAITTQPEGGSVVEILDLHVWRVGRNKFACIISLATDRPKIGAKAVKQCLSIQEEIVHVTVEIRKPDGVEPAKRTN